MVYSTLIFEQLHAVPILHGGDQFLLYAFGLNHFVKIRNIIKMRTFKDFYYLAFWAN